MKPEDDAHLVETLVSSETLLQGNFLCVKRDQVRLPDGRIAGREYVQHPGAVAIVPLLDDGRLVMVRQYRHPLSRLLLEFPAGKLDGNESTLDCARRELTEETGYRASEWAYAGFIHNAAAYSTEKIYLWFARGLVAGAQQLDQGEFLDVEVHDAAALDALAARGELTDIKTLFGLQWLQRWRAGAWALQWHTP